MGNDSLVARSFGFEGISFVLSEFAWNPIMPFIALQLDEVFEVAPFLSQEVVDDRLIELIVGYLVPRPHPRFRRR